MASITRAQLAGITSTTLLLVAAFLVWYLVLLPQPYIKALQLAVREDAAARDAYEKLKRIPGRRKQAGKLMAEVWARKAVRMEVEEGPLEAILCWLKAIKFDDNKKTRREAGRIGGEFERLRAILRHTGTVKAVTYSPDGKLIATASVDNTARIWDVATGKAVAEPLKHNRVIRHVTFSPDGKRIATGSLRFARIWDAATGKLLTEYVNQKDWIYTPTFSRDGKFLIIATSKKRLSTSL